MRWLRYLNPLTPLIDYLHDSRLRDERRQELDRLDRQEMLSTLKTIIEQSSAASQAQSKVFERFLASFDTPTPPRVREYDEEVDANRYLQGRSTRDIETYTALIDKLDRFGFDDDAS